MVSRTPGSIGAEGVSRAADFKLWSWPTVLLPSESESGWPVQIREGMPDALTRTRVLGFMIGVYYWEIRERETANASLSVAIAPAREKGNGSEGTRPCPAGAAGGCAYSGLSRSVVSDLSRGGQDTILWD